MRSRRPIAKCPPGEFEVIVEGLTHDGRGIGRIAEKPVFIPGALPEERVRFAYTSVRRDFAEGELREVLRASPLRVTPRCPHYGICGGCSFQHVRDEAQITLKSELLDEQLRRMGGLVPEERLAPLTDSAWGYRLKARLGVKFVAKKARVLVGFRERATPYIADISHCPVLDPRVGLELETLAEAIGRLSIRDRVPQIEVAMGDDRVSLVFRLLADLTEDDEAILGALGQRLSAEILIQREGPDSVRPINGAPEHRLHYALADQGIVMAFRATDFTQVNMGINRKLIARVLDLLAPEPGDRVLDLFCGIGNFTLPLARRAGWVVGVEGSAVAIDRARDNARANGLTQVAFHVADLTQPPSTAPWAEGRYDRLLLDPSRAGAVEILPEVSRWQPSRIVYVSCNPSTLARDAGVLVHELGYRLLKTGVMDMFPQTAHVESIAVFERARGRCG